MGIETYPCKISSSIFILEKILARQKKDDELCYVLQKYSFPEFAKMQKYLKGIRKVIAKHQNKMQKYFLENPELEQAFNKKLAELLPVLEEKELFVDDKIKKIFEYVNSFNSEVGL